MVNKCVYLYQYKTLESLDAGEKNESYTLHFYPKLAIFVHH